MTKNITRRLRTIGPPSNFIRLVIEFPAIGTLSNVRDPRPDVYTRPGPHQLPLNSIALFWVEQGEV